MGPVFLGTLFEKHCPRCPRSPEVLSSWLWPSLVWSRSWRKMLRKLQVAGVGSWHPLPTQGLRTATVSLLWGVGGINAHNTTIKDVGAKRPPSWAPRDTAQSPVVQRSLQPGTEASGGSRKARTGGWVPWGGIRRGGGGGLLLSLQDLPSPAILSPRQEPPAGRIPGSGRSGHRAGKCGT